MLAVSLLLSYLGYYSGKIADAVGDCRALIHLLEVALLARPAKPSWLRTKASRV
jgi:hypothetical protein